MLTSQLVAGAWEISEEMVVVVKDIAPKIPLLILTPKGNDNLGTHLG